MTTRIQTQMYSKQLGSLVLKISVTKSVQEESWSTSGLVTTEFQVPLVEACIGYIEDFYQSCQQGEWYTFKAVFSSDRAALIYMCGCAYSVTSSCSASNSQPLSRNSSFFSLAIVQTTITFYGMLNVNVWMVRQSTYLASCKLQRWQVQSNKFVQILHGGHGHWLCMTVRTVCVTHTEVSVYNSMYPSRSD